MTDNSVVTELLIDASGAQQGATVYTAAMDKASAATLGLTAANDKVQAAIAKQTVSMSSSVASQAAQFTRLAAAADPVLKAQGALEKATLTGTAALAAGKITQEQYTATIGAYQTKVEEAGKSTGTFGASLGGIRNILGGFGLVALIGALAKIPAMFADIVGAAAKLPEIADTIGITTKSLQELQFAGSQVQVSTDTMDSALERFAKNLGTASMGTGVLNKILQANHVAISGDLTKDFLNYANLIERASNAEDRNILITTAFGKSSAEMGPIFQTGASGILAAASAADQLGAVIGDEQLRKIEAIDKSWNAFTTSLSANVRSDILATVSWISDLVDQLNKLQDALGFYRNGAPVAAASVSGPGRSPSGSPFAAVIANLQQQLAARAGSTGTPGLNRSSQFATDFGGTVLPTAPDKAAASDLKNFEASLKATQKQTDALTAQAAAFGLSAGAAAEMAKQQELVDLAEQDHQKLTPALLASIDAQAKAYGDATAALQKMKDAATAEQFLGQSLFDAAKGATSLSDAFNKMADSIANAVEQALLLGTGPLAGIFGTASSGASGGLLGSLFSGLLGVGGGATNGAVALGGLYHSGGIVGETSVPGRYVHPAYFDNAPRYHSGLMPDEFPAILQRGEQVIPRGAASGASGGVSLQVTHQVNNYSSNASVTQRQEKGPNGLKLITDVVDKHLSGGGADRALRGRYGVRPQKVAS